MNRPEREAPAAITRLLAGDIEPGVYAWRTATSRASTWATQAQQAGWRPVTLDGSGIANKDAFLHQCAEAFQFPDWFGANWDALEDSLTDLEWLPARAGYLVVYDSWRNLAKADPTSFRTALDIFAEAVESWRDSPTPMAVLLPTHNNPPQLSALPTLA